MPNRVIFVNHTHWDREWYRTFEAFRGRLLDTVDRVLDLIDADPEFKFLLDGQSILLEDYLQLRPGNADRLTNAVRAGRVAIGPWYVQPDGFIPSGESAIRNLLEGRRVASEYGTPTKVGYVPDTFGHVSQLPMILRGFDLTSFVFRRGLGDAYDTVGTEFRWQGSDGTQILALHMPHGYGIASFLPDDAKEAAAQLSPVIDFLGTRSTGDTVLLMHGNDHTFPATDVPALLEALEAQTGMTVQQALLEDLASVYAGADLPVHKGELRASRNDFLLHGVLSTRVPLKVRNAAVERALELWAEPLAALDLALHGNDERPSLRAAWRALLPNHAHDSICGCSADAVHAQMPSRFDSAFELASETALRSAERLAGAKHTRGAGWDGGVDLAVFNPSPHPAGGLVSYTFDGYPPYRIWRETPESMREVGHAPAYAGPLAAKGFRVFFGDDDETGVPARRVERANMGRFVLEPGLPDLSIEFVVPDVPAFGWTKVRIEPDPEPIADRWDEGREISVGDLTAVVADDGTLTFNGFTKLLGLYDEGDRGDTYDASPVGPVCRNGKLAFVRRVRSADGVQRLTWSVLMPTFAQLSESNRGKRANQAQIQVDFEARLVPGVDRLDISVRAINTVVDHRLRLVFPTNRPGEGVAAGSPFDVIVRAPRPEKKPNWHQPPPPTFPIHGGTTVLGSGFTVLTEGLLEGEVTEKGELLVTLLRAVGWLTRMDLDTRTGITGPAIQTPGAQLYNQAVSARLAIVLSDNPARIPFETRRWRTGLLAVPAHNGGSGQPGLSVDPAPVTLSALKPAEDGSGVIVRLLNPDRETLAAIIRPGWPITQAVPVRLDETPTGDPYPVEGNVVPVEIPPRSVITVKLS